MSFPEAHLGVELHGFTNAQLAFVDKTRLKYTDQEVGIIHLVDKNSTIYFVPKLHLIHDIVYPLETPLDKSQAMTTVKYDGIHYLHVFTDNERHFSVL